MRFSQRRSYVRPAAEIRIREDAPAELREALLQIALSIELSPSQLRTILCRVLRVAPDQSNWSEYPNIWGEVEYLVRNAEWYHIYDFVEAVYEYCSSRWAVVAEKWQSEVNTYFDEAGVGWRLIDGVLEARAPEGPQATVDAATTALAELGKVTAQQEMHEALHDLSRRPHADLTGAVQHAMAALECVARDVTENPKASLGEIIQKVPDVIPRPLDASVEKAWGFASEYGRHIREGREPTRADAELIVGICAAVVTYLLRKHTSNNAV
jgi:hypothetical protein